MEKKAGRTKTVIAFKRDHAINIKPSIFLCEQEEYIAVAFKCDHAIKNSCMPAPTQIINSKPIVIHTPTI